MIAKIIPVLLFCVFVQAQSDCAGAGAGDVEIVWLVDESGSVGKRNYNSIKQAIRRMDYSDFTGQVCNGYVEFSGRNAQQTRIRGNDAIDTTCDFKEFQQRTHKVKFNPRGWTYTKSAMEYLREVYYKEKSPGFHRVLVVVSDGVPRGRGENPWDGSSTQAGAYLTDATNALVRDAQVDRLLFIAIGKNTNTSMFDDVSIFNRDTDLFITDFKMVASSISDAVLSVCSTTLAPTRAPTLAPTRAPTHAPTAKCAQSNVVFALDDSHSIGDWEGDVSREVLSAFLLNQTEWFYNSRTAVLRFANTVLEVQDFTTNQTALRASVRALVDRWGDRRRPYTKMSSIYPYLKQSQLDSYSNKTSIVMISDGLAYLRNDNKTPDADEECARWEKFKCEFPGDIQLVCVKLGKNVNPTRFYKCACDAYYHFSDTNIPTGVIREQLC